MSTNTETENQSTKPSVLIDSKALLGKSSGEHAWTASSLKAIANELRMKAVKCRRRYGNSHMKNGVEYLSDKYEEAAKIFEDALKSIDA
jgi:hypothetical protein